MLKGGELSIAWFGMKTGAVAAWMLLWMTTKTTAKKENMVSSRNPVVSTAVRQSLNASAVHLHKRAPRGKLENSGPLCMSTLLQLLLSHKTSLKTQFCAKVRPFGQDSTRLLCLVSEGTFVFQMSSLSRGKSKCSRLLRPILSTCVLWNNHPQEVGSSNIVPLLGEVL